MQVSDEHLDIINSRFRHDTALGVAATHWDLDEPQVLDIQHLADDVDCLIVTCGALRQRDWLGDGTAARASVEGASPYGSSEAVWAHEVVGIPDAEQASK